jgi:cytoskeletal protein RodZ
MTAAHVPSLGRPPRRTTRQLGAVAGGIALVLLVATGLLLWQLTRGDEPTGPTEAALTTPAAPAVAARDQPAPTIYLVASQADAAAVYAALEEANAVQVTSGEATRAPQVTWFASVEAEVQFWSTMGAQQDFHVVDLRTPAARVPELDPAALSDQEMYQRSQIDLRTSADSARGACGTPFEPASC